MNNVYNQFQSDVSSVANNMMTQLICQEKGIDYNQLMQQAQNAHLQGIMQAEQQRMMEAAIKRHYTGGQQQGIIGKLKNAFAPDPGMGLIGNPFMPPQAPMPVTPVSPQQPHQLANQLLTMPSPQPVMQPTVQEVPLSSGAGDDRINQLENDMNQLKQMITGLVQTMTGAPQQP